MLKKFDGDIGDYIAAKIVVTWLALLNVDCQLNAVQSILSALMERVPDN